MNIGGRADATDLRQAAPLTVSCRMIYRYGAPSVLKESKQRHLLHLALALAMPGLAGVSAHRVIF